MDRPSTILLATDLSASAGPATEEALRLARRLGAGLLVMTAIDAGSMRLPKVTSSAESPSQCRPGSGATSDCGPAA